MSSHRHSWSRISDTELLQDHYAFLMVCVPSEKIQDCGAIRKDALCSSHLYFWMLYPVTHAFFSLNLPNFLLSPFFNFFLLPIILACRHWDPFFLSSSFERFGMHRRTKHDKPCLVLCFFSPEGVEETENLEMI